MFRHAFLGAVVYLCFCFQTAIGKQQPLIIKSNNCSYAETLAAKEIRRFIYLRTDKLLSIIKSDGNVPDNSFIAVAKKDSELAKSISQNDKRAADLKPQEYLIKTIGSGNKKSIYIIGGDSAGALYGTYRFIEHLGVRFYLHGDVVPDKKIKLQIPQIDEIARPLFQLRGILPFHDFPEGPDWWSSDDYKAVLEQAAKMRMNFIGLHTYPEEEPNSQTGNTEPTVWIGLAEDVNENGDVKFSYPSRHFNTLNNDWGFKSKKTGDYYFGAAEIFDMDDYGANYMDGLTPWPKTEDQCNELFNRFGNVLKNVFDYAHRLEIKTCVGTEVPLTVPAAVRNKLKEKGKDPCDSAVIEEIYQGIFERIKKAYPIDYYWLWTPEDWMWKDANENQVNAVLNDFKVAEQAAEKAKVDFKLTTCGWVLGPKNDRTLFDNKLPKQMPISCINKDVGFAFVEPGFSKIAGREKWSIPWLEDDPALTIPQLWAGRMRRDAFDSLNYGCSGLMGICWRTRIISPNIAALAQAGWNQDFAKGFVTDPNKISKEPNNVPRDLPTKDFYLDWAAAEFGDNLAEPVAKIFSQLDGGPFSYVIHNRKTNLPRPATWVDGPGGIKPDERDWNDVQKAYTFIEQMEELRGQVKGRGSLERFDYWLNNFKYMREAAKLRCVYGKLNLAKAASMKEPLQEKKFANDILVPLEREMLEQLAQVHRYLLQIVSTPGEMGTVANWQQHIMPKLFEGNEEEFAQMYENSNLKKYEGPTRIIVPAVRGNLTQGEDLRMKVILLGEEEPEEMSLYYSILGENKFKKRRISHIARGVYEARIPAEKMHDDIEYYIKVVTGKNKKLYYPATAPKINQTVLTEEVKVTE